MTIYHFGNSAKTVLGENLLSLNICMRKESSKMNDLIFPLKETGK